MSYLVDTDIISELARRRPNAGVLAWANTVSSIRLSAISYEEIFCGLAWRPNERIRAWFENFLDEHCEILHVTPNIAHIAGTLRGRLGALGRPRAQADMLIAATAQVHQQTLVTRNIRNFEDCGISLLNPFQ